MSRTSEQYTEFSLHQVDVNLYNPKAHTNIIQSAYASFKLSEHFQHSIDPAAAEERESYRQIMKIQDVAQTHSRPLASRALHRPIFYDDTDSCGPMFCDGPKTFCPA